MQDLTDCTMYGKETARGGFDILARWIVEIHVPRESIGIGDNSIIARHSIGIVTTFDLIKVNLKCIKGWVY